MTEIYLIRHAQAEGNLYRMMQGHWDGAVTDLGYRQIAALEQRFAQIRVDAVYSSDLFRTRETAGAITRSNNLPLNTSEKLREINVGPWETKFFANLSHDEPELIKKFIFDPMSWQLDGAETYAEVIERAYPFMEELAESHEGQAIALVSHGVTIRCLLSRVTGIDPKETDKLPICNNTAVSKLCYENGVFSLEYMNDYEHIIPLGAGDWKRIGELRDEPMDSARDAEYYMACYGDSWQTAHGSLEGFNAASYFKSAMQHQKEDKRAVLCLYKGDEAAGLLDLDTKHGKAANYGWISLIYLKPEFRGMGYGIQALARAIARYKELGRSAIRLHVAEANEQAIKFYKANGFKELGSETNSLGRLLLMEKKLGGRRGV